MMNEEQLFSQICERCENHANNMNCEDMDTCPAYNLYLMAKKKRKVSYKQSDWGTPPTPRPEMI
jgi:hypothetical protein